MIRPLRRRHRRAIPTLFLLLVVMALLAIARPAPSTRVDALPAPIATAHKSPNSR